MYDMYTLYRDITQTMSMIQKGEFGRLLGLDEYCQKITSLESYAKSLEKAGYALDVIAHAVYDRRVTLTRHFLEETPEIVHLYLNDLTDQDYGYIDLQPFEQMKEKMSNHEIISYCSQVGYDLKKWTSPESFMPWLERKLFTLYR